MYDAPRGRKPPSAKGGGQADFVMDPGAGNEHAVDTVVFAAVPAFGSAPRWATSCCDPSTKHSHYPSSPIWAFFFVHLLKHFFLILVASDQHQHNVIRTVGILDFHVLFVSFFCPLSVLSCCSLSCVRLSLRHRRTQALKPCLASSGLCPDDFIFRLGSRRS